MKRGLAVLLAGTLLWAAGCGSSAGSGQTLTVGSKQFTESIILGEMAAQLVEKKMGIPVKRKLNLGGTLVVYQALTQGEIDFYVDYDGTAYQVQLQITDPILDPAAVYPLVTEKLQGKNIRVSEPLGFNNTYALALPRNLAEKYRLKTYSDLAAVSSSFIFGTEQEFMGRPDGYDGLVAAYGFRFKDVKTMDSGLKYRAVQQGKVDVIDAYATDGQLKTFDMVILEDDKHFFPPYNAMFLVRQTAANAYPDLMATLNLLAGKLSDETMQELNYRVDELGESPEKVAREFLAQAGLVP
ncbi:MAG: glycine betaine ABC transporter substrate-binding protein [Bacillota bacterium]|nr:glycine betaine ABC transporter substrate-binding protein [Bacillota bacterium]